MHEGKPQQDDTGFIDSRCSRHMTGNIAYLLDSKEFDGDFVTFRGGAHGGRISSKGTLKTDSLDFEDVYFVNELRFNLFSVSQMCDKKNYVLFTDTECLVLSPNFMLPDEKGSHTMLLVSPKFMYPSYQFFVLTSYGFVWSILVNETSEILKNFIKEIENLVDKKVKIIRSDNGTEFKNKVMDDFCREKGIKREYSVARTPQQNGVAKRRNRTLIEAARTIGLKPALSFMRPFGCHVTILNNLDNLAKFDGKSDEGIQGELNAGTSTQKEEIRQDFIVMPIWKDASYFDSPSKDVGNGEPKSTSSDHNAAFEDGPHNESDEKDKSDDDSSPKKVNTVGQHVNTVSPEVNTGRFKLNIVVLSIEPTSIAKALSDLFLGGSNSGRKLMHSSLPNQFGKLYGFAYMEEGPLEQNGISKDLKSAFFYGKTLRISGLGYSTLDLKVPDHQTKFTRVVKALYGLHIKIQGSMKEAEYFRSRIKYVAEILKKFNYIDVKSASTPVDLEKPLVKDGDDDVVVIPDKVYTKDITSLSNQEITHRIFRISQTVKPTLRPLGILGLSFELVGGLYTNSDYAGATQDRKSTTRGCQFLGNRLISWQCKKQTVVATSTTKAEYVAAASCCGQIFLQKVLMLEGSVLGLKHLKLEDADGISSLPNSEIFEQLALMTYASNSDKLTFQNGHFSPQWRFLIHTILHLLKP
ncbi:putative ribonuclease H-like domain-containing protein [Tanacetum coccineum]|uniref:Ribonuclease H-like domain-containing protein n=1 Tax=Tanacetum coccineum TaxID=301880 RepID=A0ABQ5FQS9_9ASTR